MLHQVIGMGLPKTGTTTLSYELKNAGYHVAHNLGDRLSLTCNAICNTMENEYEILFKRHPNATWIITHSENVSSWIESVDYHKMKYMKNSSLYECRYYGCVLPTPVSFKDNSELEYRYYLYYKKLFTFLNLKNIRYGIIDYRKKYRWNVQLLNSSSDFHINSKKKPMHGVHDYKFCPKVPKSTKQRRKK